MIKKKLKKIYDSTYFPMIILFLAIWIVLLRIGLIEGSDDTAHFEALSQNSIFEWLKNIILTWQPRIYADIMYALFLDKLPLWRILNSLHLVALLFCIFKLADDNIDKKNARVLSGFLCCIFFFISPYVITSGLMWYTGSFFYLWATTAMMVALVPFCYAIKEKSIVYKNLNVLFAIAAICGSYIEQANAILVCFGSLCILYLYLCKKPIQKNVIIQYILVIINCSTYWLLNTLGNRLNAEVHWYIGFDMLSLVDKVFQGINWTNYHYINSSSLLMLIIATLLFLVIYKKGNAFEKLIGALPMIFFIIRILPFDIIFKNININNSNAQYYTGATNPYSFETYLNNFIYNTSQVNPQNLLDKSYGKLLPSFIGLFVMLFIAVLLWIAFDNKADKFLASILYVAALASGYIIGFSPTIYASGSRVFFVGNVLMIYVAAKLLNELLRLKVIVPKWVKVVFLILTMLFWFIILFQFTNSILWL